MCNPHESTRLISEPQCTAVPDDKRRALEWALDSVDVGLVFVDAAGHPVFANAIARRIADERDGLRISSFGLSTSDPASSRRFLDLVCQLAFLRAPGPFRIQVERLARDRPLLLTLVRIPSAELLDAIAMKAVVAVFIRDLGEDPRVDRGALALAFDLTRREAEIAALLGQGVGLQSIAVRLKIGLGTVRSHLKHVFHKTGTRSQMTLAMLARQFADQADLCLSRARRSAD
jgi:DNA-binding CsgD family transcriptional regulator